MTSYEYFSIELRQSHNLPDEPHHTSADDTPRPTRFELLVTSFEYLSIELPALSRVPWRHLVVDEAHRCALSSTPTPHR